MYFLNWYNKLLQRSGAANKNECQISYIFVDYIFIIYFVDCIFYIFFPSFVML